MALYPFTTAALTSLTAAGTMFSRRAVAILAGKRDPLE